LREDRSIYEIRGLVGGCRRCAYCAGHDIVRYAVEL